MKLVYNDQNNETCTNIATRTMKLAYSDQNNETCSRINGTNRLARARGEQF